MKKLLWLAPVLVFLIACDKDKFQTKPQIEVKSLVTFVPIGGQFEARFSYTDKEGDLGTGQFVYKPILVNKRPLTPSSVPYDTISLPIPTYPDKSNGEIKLSFERTFIYKDIQRLGGTDTNDTLYLKVFVRDKAGNVSDTITTDNIVIQGN